MLVEPLVTEMSILRELGPVVVTGALGNAVDVVVEVTGSVLLALDSLSNFFSAFFLALQFSVVCLPFLQ